MTTATDSASPELALGPNPADLRTQRIHAHEKSAWMLRSLLA